MLSWTAIRVSTIAGLALPGLSVPNVHAQFRPGGTVPGILYAKRRRTFETLISGWLLKTGFRPVFTARTGGRWFLRQWLSSGARPDTVVVTANVSCSPRHGVTKIKNPRTKTASRDHFRGLCTLRPPGIRFK